MPKKPAAPKRSKQPAPKLPRTRVSGTTPNRRFRWVVEIEVAETWVEDGFDLNDERAHEMLANHLRHAYGHELGARVLKAPDPELVKKVQGG